MKRGGLAHLVWQRCLTAGAAAALALSATVSAAFAAGGHVVSLTATDGPNPGDTIAVNSTVQADSKTNSSNLYYEITAPSGTLVATHQTDPGNLNSGQTFSDSWGADNSGFPDVGTYTVSLCWSTGNSHNCDLASAATAFYSVPTLGWPLGLLALGMLAVFLWRQRADFGGPPL